MGDRTSKVGAIFRVASGNFFEMYDFQVYAYYAVYIAHAFFPSKNEFASLMASLGTFAAGNLMRPLGALVLGAYIDQHGRRAGLLLSLALMAVGTAGIALTPSYAQIGVAAPLLVLAARLLQGFSAGVQLGGVSVYLSEIAPPGRVGFFTAWQSASQQVSVMLAAGFGVIMSLVLPPAAVEAWGWRTPFILGCLIVPLLLMMRRTLEETEVFLSKAERPGMGKLMISIGAHWRLVLTGMFLIAMTTATFYVSTAYTPTYGQTVLHLSAQSSRLVAVFVGLSNFIWLPIFGALSDKVGRRPILIAFSLISMLTAYPVMLWLVAAPSFWRMLAAELWLSLMFGGYNGALTPYLTEIMPFKVRTLAFSLAFSLATAVFGGMSPFICTLLIHQTGNAAMPGVWLAFVALCGLGATLASGGAARRAAAEAAPGAPPQLSPAGTA